MPLKGLSLIFYIKAFARLIRLPNVLIILLTQFLLRYCILLPYLYACEPGSISPFPDFLILVSITAMIAVGGYVINDYFDVKIDSVNRPGKQVVNRFISGHAAIKLHIIVNVIAILLGFYLAWRLKALTFGFIFPFISALLWIYSAKYKRTVFWGNFIVAGLSAFVILLVWLFEFFWLRLNDLLFISVLPGIHWVTSLFIAYAAFAFLVSMVREIVKDMEDAEGDEMAGCKTLPLVAGNYYTRVIVGAIVLAILILLVFAQLTLYRLSLSVAFWYFIFPIQSCVFYLLVKLFFARDKQAYHFLSTLCKLIMVAGILSMEVILISN